MNGQTENISINQDAASDRSRASRRWNMSTREITTDHKFRLVEHNRSINIRLAGVDDENCAGGIVQYSLDEDNDGKSIGEHRFKTRNN